MDLELYDACPRLLVLLTVGTALLFCICCKCILFVWFFPRKCPKFHILLESKVFNVSEINESDICDHPVITLLEWISSPIDAVVSSFKSGGMGRLTGEYTFQLLLMPGKNEILCLKLKKKLRRGGLKGVCYIFTGERIPISSRFHMFGG